MRIDLLWFGRLAETGHPSGAVDLPDGIADVAGLRRWLDFDDPAARAVVNQEMVGDAHAIVAGDEIAFIPPVSGG